MKTKLLAFFIAFSCLIPSALAGDIFDEANTTVIGEDGLIFNTTIATYYENGSWENGGLGFSEHILRKSSQAGAKAGWDGVRPGDNGYYEVYIWKNVIENGDPNVLVSWFATGSSSGTCFIDCSTGETGWEYVGTTNTSDLVFDIDITASGEGVATISCFRLVRTTKDAFINYLNTGGDRVLTLKIGAKTALLNDRKVNMTMGEAVINNSRTMVPLRFIMEIMGADVEWDGETQKITITYGDKTIVFTVGSSEYSVNGEAKVLDSAPYIVNDRTMVPLRVFSEAVEKKVYWDDRGVVVISGAELSDYISVVEKGLGL